MKKIKSLITLPLIGLLLVGCSKQVDYKPKDYQIKIRWKDTSKDFRILQMGDIHFSQSDLYEEHFKVMDKTVETANADLIVLNGDCFTYADKHVVDILFSHIDSYNIPWTFTFGNHDDQGYYPDTYIQRLLGGKKYSHVLFKNNEGDKVTGRSNFVIDIVDHQYDTNGKLLTPSLYNVYILESHSYNFDDFHYDFIKQDQIDWFKEMAEYFKGDRATYVPSSLYMHIPTPEFYEAGELAMNGDPSVTLKMGTTEEFYIGGPSEEADLGLFDVFKERGGQSMSCAHDHTNDSVIEYQGVNLCFGVHSTDRIYCDYAKIGGQVISVGHVDQKLSFENIYVDYNSLEAKVIHEKTN